jgi:hypothetical protein
VPFSILAGLRFVSTAKSNAMGGISNTQADDSDGNGTSTSVNLLGPVFRAEIDLSDYDLGDRLVLIASATVDETTMTMTTITPTMRKMRVMRNWNKRCMEIRLLMLTSAITKMNQRCMEVRLLMLTSTITEMNQRCMEI